MKEKLINDIVTRSISFTSAKWVMERVPFIFNEDLDEYIRWKEALSGLINVDSKSIVFTGSASVGFSLNPEMNLKPFDEESDIDVAIISQLYFDISWHFLRNVGPKIYSYNSKVKNAIEDHRKRLIYWGTIATDKIIQILPFGMTWVSAIHEMSKISPTKGREINFRIYKDFEALKAYQSNSLREIKLKLTLN